MPKKTIRPAPGRVVVRKLDGAEARIDIGGGKFLLIAGQDPRYEGHFGVVEQESQPYMTSAGTEVEPSFHRGQVVIFGKFTGTRIEIDRQEFYIMNESQIIGELIEVSDEPQSG